MSNPFAKPERITIETLPQLFAHHRARFGGWQMVEDGGDPPPAGPAPVERPEGVSEDEWAALGDPGKQALVRERQRADAAERALVASRAKPAPPKTQTPPTTPPETAEPKPGGDAPDMAEIIKQAVAEAVKPFAEAEQQRQTEAAAERVRQSVLDAAKVTLHDPTDALANLDLSTVVADDGTADAEKVKDALDDLVKRKPHLAKSTARVAPPGIGGGAPMTAAVEADAVKATLAQMYAATGVRKPVSTSTT